MSQTNPLESEQDYQALSAHQAQYLTREQLIDWLVWNDGNGCYSDQDSESEGLKPLTLESALKLVLAAINGD